MGAGASTSFSKPEILLALKSRVLDPADDIWDDLVEAAANPVSLAQLKFDELAEVLSLRPGNVAVALYRFTTSLYALMNDEKPNVNGIVNHLRLLSWFLPPVLSTRDSDLVDWILFHNGPLDTKELIKGPRKIVHPPPAVGKETPRADFILRVPGPEEDAHMSLAESLVIILTKLLFLPGFTVSTEAVESNNLIWFVLSRSTCSYLTYFSRGAGIGCGSAKKATTAMISHRIEVLRTILACLSSPLYQTAEGTVLLLPIVYTCS